MNKNEAKKLDYRIVRKFSFKYEQVWIVDIEASPENDCYEFWLRHKDYAYKMLMFGIPMDKKLIDFIDQLPEYIKEYRPHYEEEMRP